MGAVGRCNSLAIHGVADAADALTGTRLHTRAAGQGQDDVPTLLCEAGPFA
jgi:hypothetical protein